MISLQKVYDKLTSDDTSWEMWDEIYDELYIATERYNKSKKSFTQKTPYETLLDLLKAYITEKWIVGTCENINHNTATWDYLLLKDEFPMLGKEKYKPDLITAEGIEVEVKNLYKTEDITLWFSGKLQTGKIKDHGAKCIAAYSPTNEAVYIFDKEDKTWVYRNSFVLRLNGFFEKIENSPNIKKLFDHKGLYKRVSA